MRPAKSKRATGVTVERNSITVENKEIPIEPIRVPLDEVVLDPDNPRTREQLEELGFGARKPAGRDDLRRLLWALPDVQKLYADIRDNGGLLERILVDENLRVVEGNCRTVSFLQLRDTFAGDARWESIPAYRLPNGTAEHEIAIIQAHWHVRGKMTWGPLEKASHAHRMYKVLKMDLAAVAKVVGLSEAEVLKECDNFEIVKKKLIPKLGRKEGKKKYSYVAEFNKSRKLKEFRDEPGAVDWFTKIVAENRFSRGEEVRDLPAIVANPEAKKALERSGHEAAMAVLARKDPTIATPGRKRAASVLKKLQKAAAALEGMETTELDELKTDKRAQDILRKLHQSVVEVADLAKVSLE